MNPDTSTLWILAAPSPACRTRPPPHLCDPATANQDLLLRGPERSIPAVLLTGEIRTASITRRISSAVHLSPCCGIGRRCFFFVGFTIKSREQQMRIQLLQQQNAHLKR